MTAARHAVYGHAVSEPNFEMPEIQESHAEECVRLANLSKDDVVRAELLKLRQTYLRSAERLRALVAPKK